LSVKVHALFRLQHFALKKVDFDSYRQLCEFKFWQRSSCVLERRWLSVCCGINITASLVKFRAATVNTFSQLDGNLMGVSLYGTSVVGPVW